MRPSPEFLVRHGIMAVAVPAAVALGAVMSLVTFFIYGAEAVSVLGFLAEAALALVITVPIGLLRAWHLWTVAAA